MDERIILINKTKLSVNIAGACLFVAIGCLMLFRGSEDIASLPPSFLNVAITKAISLVTIAFFGFIGVACVMRLFDSRPGLVLSESGLDDNSSAVSGGVVAWSDISGMKLMCIGSQRFLAIYLVDAESFLSRFHPAKAFYLRLNIKLVATPFSISSRLLHIKFDDLETLCNMYWQKYKVHGDDKQQVPQTT